MVQEIWSLEFMEATFEIFDMLHSIELITGFISISLLSIHGMHDIRALYDYNSIYIP